jgi:hypothetical protein
VQNVDGDVIVDVLICCFRKKLCAASLSQMRHRSLNSASNNKGKMLQ